MCIAGLAIGAGYAADIASHSGSRPGVSRARLR